MAESPSVKFSSFAAVFTVKDVAQAMDFYTQKLGFKIEFKYGEPVQYAAVERDQVSIHLMPVSQSPTTLGVSSVYVFTGDVDGVDRDLRGRGCAIEMAPKDLPYGMREMSVRDLDGNRLSFGQPMPRQ